MSKRKLREAIAVEAARLMLRRKESDLVAARKRAARWLSRRKVDARDMPTHAEIQRQVYALAGLFSDEHQAAQMFQMRQAALDLMLVLEEFQPRIHGCAVDGPVLTGATITVSVVSESSAKVASTLRQAGFRPGRASGPDTVVRIYHRFPCEISVHADAGLQTLSGSSLNISALQEMLENAAEADAHPGDPDDTSLPEDEYHPDAFAAIRMLLLGLKNVSLDPELHPEGNAQYHSLQVFELGRAERPYDEEFLLACLLHDVGKGLDRRNATRAAVEALGPLLTDRTLFLIEHRAEAVEFLATGRAPRSLRRSEHFEDLLLLAHCDIDGRIPGADVPEVDEALGYIAGLSTAWDNA